MEFLSDELSSTNVLKPADLQHAFLSFKQASDTEIWGEFKRGSQSAFEFIYVKYFPLLFNYGRQFSCDTDLVQDIIQDLFIYLQEKKAGLADVSSIKFYLYKSYKTRIVRHLGKNKFSWEELDYDRNQGFEVMIGDDFSTISLDEELRQKMEKAFTLLTKRQKEVIIYYFYEGFSYAQITSLMGFTKIEYARILMSRTILKLRKELGESMFALDMLVFAMLMKSAPFD